MTTSLRDILVEDLPPRFVTDLREAVVAVYTDVHREIEADDSLDDSNKQFIAPLMRRARIETCFSRLAIQHGLRAQSMRVRTGASEHTEVVAGRVRLTCSRTQTRTIVPRKAKFREQLSTINEHADQYELWPQESTPADAELYAVLVHAPNPERRSEVGFLSIGFPDSGGENWVANPADLIDIEAYQSHRYQKAQDLRPDHDEVMPKLKTARKAANDAP